MRRLSFLLFALLALMALPAAAQINDTYIIPVSGNTPGAFGTRWMTSFSVMNPQAYALTISVVFVPTGGAIGDEVFFDIPANSVGYSDNILLDAFDVAGSGALLVATFPEDNPDVDDEMIARAFLVTTNTFNDSAAGTFGTTVPGVWAGLQDYESDGISAIAHGIRNLSAQGWRTNIGAVNLGRRSVTMHVNAYDYDGNRVLNQAPFTIPPMAHIQDTLPVQLDRGSVEFFVDDVSLEAVVFPYASVVDQYSGDPSYQSPILLASPALLYSKGVSFKRGLTPFETLAAAQNPGKKLTTAIAREVRATAKRSGLLVMKKEAKGYRITR